MESGVAVRRNRSRARGFLSNQLRKGGFAGSALAKAASFWGETLAMNCRWARALAKEGFLRRGSRVSGEILVGAEGFFWAM